MKTTPFNMIKKLFYALAALTICMATPIAVSADRDHTPVNPIVAVVPEDFPPLFFKDNKTGKPTGFGVEVIEKIAEKINIPVTFVYGRPWEEIEQMLQDGKADIIPLRVINPKTSERFLFTDTLYTSPMSYVVRSSGKRPVLRSGISVGVINGSTAHVYLSKEKPDFNAVPYKDFQSMLLAILSGHIDIVLTAPENLMHYARQSNLGERLTVLSPPVAENKWGVAINRSNRELQERLNQAVKEFVHTSDYEHLYQKWLTTEDDKFSERELKVVAALISAIVLVFLLVHYTMLRRKNKEIKAEQQFLQKMIDAVPDLIFFKDRNFKYLGCNRVFAEDFMGRDRETIVGSDDFKLFGDPELAEFFRQLDRQTMERGGVLTTEEQVTMADGHNITVESLKTTFTDAGGNVAGIIGVVRNITGRKLAEKELQIKSSAIESSLSGIALASMEGRLTYVNPAWLAMHGYNTHDEVLGTTPSEHVLDPAIADTVVASIVSDKQWSGELQCRRRDGSGFWAELSANVVHDSPGNQICMFASFHDISKRKQVEIDLQQREEKFRLVADFTYDWEYWLSPEGNFIYCSPSCLHITGISADQFMADSQLLKNITHPDDRDNVEHHIDGIRKCSDELHESEFRIIVRSGETRWISHVCRCVYGEDGSYLGRRAANRDITERKVQEQERTRLEQQMQHAQKLESLGVLAGGIAHDYNNLLMAIIGNADLALMRLNRESPAISNLQQIIQAADKAADLAKQMLAYSGKGKFVIEQLDLNLLVKEMLNMLEVSISKKSVLRLNPYQPLPLVEADATQIRQIIMNLVINASEAIGDKSGVIAITTGCMDCDRSYLDNLWLKENIKEGLYVYLEIADTGCGMDKDTLSKLFDPFFTTKFTGRGLGMAAVLGIVRGHQGAIKVYSELKKGTTFKILLPASTKPSELYNGSALPNDDWFGDGTVLLVDDEESVRGIGSEMLREIGFTPVTAADGRDALDIYRNRPDIRLVILDLTMPHMDGEQCFRELKRLNNDVIVIMSSGFNQQEVTQKFVGKGIAGFIQKPYRLSALRDEIRKSTDVSGGKS